MTTYKTTDNPWIMRYFKTILALLALASAASIHAQEKIVNPDISYAGIPRTYTVGGIAVSGVEGYEDFMLTGISGMLEEYNAKLRIIAEKPHHERRKTQ